MKLFCSRFKQQIINTAIPRNKLQNESKQYNNDRSAGRMPYIKISYNDKKKKHNYDFWKKLIAGKCLQMHHRREEKKSCLQIFNFKLAICLLKDIKLLRLHKIIYIITSILCSLYSDINSLILYHYICVLVIFKGFKLKQKKF